VCGICGLAAADPARPVASGVVERMAATLAHRGPDGEGFHRGPGIALGARRLAVIDPAGGGQPLASEDGAVVLVCNGEIYNAPELRAGLEARGHRFRGGSDAEVIVHLWEEVGEALLGRLRGMFALALWDARERRLLLARDRVGIKPLSYAHRPEGLWFGSEAKAVAAGGGWSGEADPDAVADLLDFGFVTGDRCLFAGVRRLSPGHLLAYREGRVEVRRWWRWPARTGAVRRSPGEWAKALRDTLHETVAVHLRSDVPVGAWLSTGIDSSTVAALAAEILGRPLPAFTLEMPGSGWDETRGRRTLADLPGRGWPSLRVACVEAAFRLLPAAVWHVEEATPVVMEIGRMLLAQASARQVKVVLTGEGADELLFGYGYFRLDRAARRLAAAPALASRLVGRSGRPRLHALLRGSQAAGRERLANLVGPGVIWTGRDLRGPRLRETHRRADLVEPVAGLSADDRVAALLRENLLPHQIVHTLDRGAMAHGVEARVPFLDHRLIELCAELPPRLGFSWRREKIVLRRAIAGLVPDQIRARPKRAPTLPFEAWLRGPLPGFAARLLDPAEVRRKGFFDPAAVAEVLAAHRTGRARLGTVLMVVLAVHLWHELFAEGASAAAVAAE